MKNESLQKILISIPDQRLDLVSASGPVTASWPVSTSKYGTGTGEGSFRTPTGSFRICEKIGDGAPPWSIFRSRCPIGEIALPGGDEDLILSRILWLEGIDPENSNTRDRFIYLHGTNHESLIGSPASHGCIRLSNADIVDLYDRVKVGMDVEIRA